MIKKLVLATLAVLSFSFVGSSIAQAVDLQPATFKDFYLQSRITHYDRNATDNPGCKPSSPLIGGGGATSSTPLSPVIGSNNTETTWNFFIAQGFTAVQVAGIIGNFMQESNMDPRIVQGGGHADSPVPGKGYGLAQWTDSFRQNGLKRFAAANNGSPGDLSIQLNFVMHELRNAESASMGIRSQTTVEAATIFWLDKYERAGHRAETNRINYAKQAFAQYANSTAPQPQPGDEAPTDSGQDNQQPDESSGSATGDCPVPQPSVGSGYSGESGSGGTNSPPTTANSPGNLSDPNQACANGTRDLGVQRTTYTGSLVSSPNPTIRLCEITSIPGARLNAAVSAQFQAMGEAAKAAGITLTSKSSFRAGDSCGGSGNGGSCAKPGQSSHQIGIAIDFVLNDDRYINQATCGSSRSTSTDKRWIWLKNNAPRFGIWQYASENWHWDAVNPSINPTRCQ